MRGFLLTLVLLASTLLFGSVDANANMTLLGAGSSGCIAISAPTGGIYSSTTLAGGLTFSTGTFTPTDALSPDCVNNGGTWVEGTSSGVQQTWTLDGGTTFAFGAGATTTTVWVKQGVGTRYAAIELSGPAPDYGIAYVYINPTLGTVVGSGTDFVGDTNPPTAVVTAAPFGYWKVVMSYTFSTSQTGMTLQVGSADATCGINYPGCNDVTYTGDGVSSLGFWAYNTTSSCSAVSPPSGGLYDDETLTDWTASFVAGDVIDGGTVISPDCTLDGSSFVESTGTGSHQIVIPAEITHSFASGSTSATMSVYASADTAQDRYIILQMMDQSFGARVGCMFNLVTGTSVGTPEANTWASPTCTATASQSGFWLLTMNTTVVTSVTGLYSMMYAAPTSTTDATTFLSGSGYVGTAGSGFNVWGSSITVP